MIHEFRLPERAWIARMDPRLRFLAALMFAILVSMSQRWETLGMAIVWAGLVARDSQLFRQGFGKRWLRLNQLMILFWCLLPFTVPGHPVVLFELISLSDAGLVLAAQLTLKMNAIVLVYMGLVATMPIATLGHALHRLRVPDKLVFLLWLTYRYVFVLEQEFQRLITAAKMRGFQPKTNLHTYKTYAYLLGMLFVRASWKAEQVHQAMKCRGFQYRFHSLQTFTLSRWDAWAGLLNGALLVGLGSCEWLLSVDIVGWVV